MQPAPNAASAPAQRPADAPLPEHVRFVVIGAGVTGLAFANFLDSDDVLILERDAEVGGYCKTVHHPAGFVWDYSGHFFHFRHQDIERYLVERMAPDQTVETIAKVAEVLYKGHRIDFPFQKNIHQLPQQDFIDCLYDLYFRDADAEPTSFARMLYARFGRSIAEKFLIPYNAKLYACDLDTLDHDAMGRFFPYASVEDIVRNFRRPDNASYNATFTYPSGGAIQYVHALCRDLPAGALALSHGVTRVDLARKQVHTDTGHTVGFDTLVSSAPFNRLMDMVGLPYDARAITSNKVLVFNLGFDRKGWAEPHWVYIPDPDVAFYRVGFYDNIFGTDRMSLYVEIGLPTDAPVAVEASLARVLADLKAVGIVTDHQLIAHHSVVLDPAYVHIRTASREAVAQARALLQTQGVYTVGRYGGWTYCSIEDNILEARDLAALFNTLDAL